MGWRSAWISLLWNDGEAEGVLWHQVALVLLSIHVEDESAVDANVDVEGEDILLGSGGDDAGSVVAGDLGVDRQGASVGGGPGGLVESGLGPVVVGLGDIGVDDGGAVHLLEAGLEDEDLLVVSGAETVGHLSVEEGDGVVVEGEAAELSG